MSVPERETTERLIAAVADEVVIVPDDVVVVTDDVDGSGQADVAVQQPAGGTALSGYRRIAAVLAVADALAIVATLFLLHLKGPGYLGLNRDMVLVLIVAPIVWVAVFHSFGLYVIRHLSAPEEFRRVISATTLAVVVIMVGSVWWEEALDRRSLALTWIVALLIELIVRRVVRWHVGQMRADGRLALRTLIVGTNEEALTIGDALADPVRGFVPLGFLSSSGAPSGAAAGPVLGSIDDLPELIRERSAECVFVASTSVSAADVFLVSRCCRLANIDMRVSANTREVLTSRVSVHQVQDLMVLAVRSAQLTGTQSAMKRSFDLAISSIALLALSPLMAAIALAVKMTSPGPILFRQERITKDGRPFTVLKFRTMVVDADRDQVLDLSQAFFKMRTDPRMTRIGSVLRSFSLDELPQLWNVIRGDMSLVGPRPLAREQVEANHELLEPRHEVRAGLTGWWQINGRSEVEAQDALKMDLFYIENWSLTLDMYVLLKTVGVVIGRKGAY